MTYPPILDLSNYTPNFTLAEAQNLYNNFGVRKVIIQAINPPASYPEGKTRAQIDVALQANMLVGIYFFHWFEDIAGGLESRIALLDGYENDIDDYYLDVEDNTTGTTWSVQDRVNSVNASLDRIDQETSKVGFTRMYSGRWFMSTFMIDADYSNREWWVAQYDASPDASDVEGWNGIGTVVLKQYAGSSTFGDKHKQMRRYTPAEMSDIHNPHAVGINIALRQAHKGHFRYGTVSGIDLSVPTDAEWQRMTVDPNSNPNEDPCQDVTNAKNGLVSSLGWLGGDAMVQSGVLKSTSKYVNSKYVRAYLDMVRHECDAHGIQHR